MFTRWFSPGSASMRTAVAAVAPAVAVEELGAEWHPYANAATTRVVAAEKACLVMRGKLSLRPRRDEGEQVLLRLSSLDDLDGLPELRVVIQRASTYGGVTEGRPRDTYLEVAINER